MNLFDKFNQALPYTEFMARYGKPTDEARWRRVIEQVTLTPAQRELLSKFTREMNVLVLAGAWCGDCVSQCPIFDHFAAVAPIVKVRYLDRDAHADAQRVLQINGGNRVPVVLFFSEDGHEVAHFGERTLSRYRSLVTQQVGEVCASGVVTTGDALLAQVTQDWLDEFERVQWLLRLSPRLRQMHGD